MRNEDASVKSILPPRFWGIGLVFAMFFGLLTVASMNNELPMMNVNIKHQTSNIKHQMKRTRGVSPSPCKTGKEPPPPPLRGHA
jgi:hypothetical protein